jgi:hypothetical protein
VIASSSCPANEGSAQAAVLQFDVAAVSPCLRDRQMAAYSRLYMKLYHCPSGRALGTNREFMLIYRVRPTARALPVGPLLWP